MNTWNIPKRKPRGRRGGFSAPVYAVLALLGGVALCGPVLQGADARLAWGTLGGGAVTASNDGEHVLSATAGQALAATASAGGQALSSGFWPVALGAPPVEGVVTCTILPEAVRALGAQWRLTTGPDTDWQDSGATVPAVPVAGNPYTVTFRAVTGWISPADQTAVTVVGGETTTVQGTYTLRTYTLTYLAGANGAVTGPTPQTVDHGGTGAAVTAVPAACVHFVRWSDGSTANPRSDANVTADLTVTAEFAVDQYTLTYLAGPNGAVTGLTPQDVDCGGSGAAVTAVPDPGYHFTSWSDGSADNPRRDRVVVADLTVTAQFAINVYTITFLAELGGSIVGSAVQSVNHGGSTAPVTAMPPYLFVFERWSDGSTANPRVLPGVASSQTLTARFRQATPVLPEGPFLAIVGTAEAAAGKGLWDLSGAYTTGVKGDTLTMDLVHDTKGKITGTATYTAAKTTAVDMPVKGRAKGSGGALAVTLAMSGSDPAQTVSVNLTLTLTLNAGTRQLAGTMAGTVTVGQVKTPVLAEIVLDVPPPMDGTWTLALLLAPGTKGIAGTARLTLSNASRYDYLVKGKVAGQAVVLSLAADKADPAAKGIKLKGTVLPLEGGWAGLEALSAKGYGQAPAW